MLSLLLYWFFTTQRRVHTRERVLRDAFFTALLILYYTEMGSYKRTSSTWCCRLSSCTQSSLTRTSATCGGIYYCFTTALLLLYYCFIGRTLWLGQARHVAVFTTALRLLYDCFNTDFTTDFTSALLRLYYCCTAALLQVCWHEWLWQARRVQTALLVLYCCFTTGMWTRMAMGIWITSSSALPSR